MTGAGWVVDPMPDWFFNTAAVMLLVLIGTFVVFGVALTGIILISTVRTAIEERKMKR